MDDKVEIIRKAYYPLQKSYGVARENRNKARLNGDSLALEYYKGECAAYSDAIHTLDTIIYELNLNDFVFSTR